MLQQPFLCQGDLLPRDHYLAACAQEAWPWVLLSTCSVWTAHQGQPHCPTAGARRRRRLTLASQAITCSTSPPEAGVCLNLLQADQELLGTHSLRPAQEELGALKATLGGTQHPAVVPKTQDGRMMARGRG